MSGKIPSKSDYSDALLVEFDDFIDFLNEKIKDAKCNYCGHDSFSCSGIETDDGVKLFESSLTVHNGRDPRPFGYHGFYSYYCENCGHGYFVKSSVVSDWLEERSANGGSHD